MNRLRQRKIIRATVGDLIAAVTDEVTAAFGDSPDTYVVVADIVADLLIRHRLPAQRCSVRGVVLKRSNLLQKEL